MDVVALVVLAGALIFLAHFFRWLFSFTTIPDSLLLILVGVLLGPILGLLTPAFFGESIEVFLVLALVVILFESGTELQWSVITQAWRSTLALTATSFLTVMVAVGVLGWLLWQWDPLLSFMAGAIIGGTTSAIVVSLLEHVTLAPESRAMLILESAFSDVLTIVVAVALLQAFQVGDFSVPGVSLAIMVSFVAAALVGVVGALLWSLLLQRVRHVQDSLFMTPSFVFLLYGVVEWLGWQGLIAALFFGVTLGNTPQLRTYMQNRHKWLALLFRPESLSRRERAFFSEAVFLFQTFFFVYVGLTIQVTSVLPLLAGVGVTGLLLLVRILVVRASVPRTVSIQDASLMAVLIPRGLAAAVLAAVAAQAQIPFGVFIQDTVYVVILGSVVATSLLVYLLQRSFVRYLYSRLLSGFSTEAVSISNS